MQISMEIGESLAVLISEQPHKVEEILKSPTVLNTYRVGPDIVKTRECGCYLWLRDACNWMNPSGSGCD